MLWRARYHWRHGDGWRQPASSHDDGGDDAEGGEGAVAVVPVGAAEPPGCWLEVWAAEAPWWVTYAAALVWCGTLSEG